jgi:hypothetical protein
LEGGNYKMLHLATFNVENLFDRISIMNLPTWEEGRPVIEDFDRLNDLISIETYTEENKDEMLKLMKNYKGLLNEDSSKYIRLRKIRGNFKKKPKNGAYEIAANGRTDWVGWFELNTEPVKETSIENTARVIRELKADILCVIEAEDRITLKKFNDDIIPNVDGQTFDHVMLIDGNDDRKIDVGIMTRGDYPIVSMFSHVDDTDETGTIFSRDCVEYAILTSSGQKLLVLINHFKSKGHGTVCIGCET